jgi:hypothetical protein
VKKLLFIVVMCMVSLVSFGQSEPEFELEPYVFNTTDSTFTNPLPCENTYLKSKAAASMFLVGVGKIKSYYYIKGEKSSLVIDNKNCNIIINTGGNSPQQILSLIKLERLETKRRWKTGEMGAFTGSSFNEDNSIPLKYKKYGENSVIIDISQLEHGDYCIAISSMMTNIKSSKVYTFRIKKNKKDND